MRTTIGSLAASWIFACIGLVMVSHASPPNAQVKDRGRTFVAQAKRGDEHAVRKSLEQDSTLVHSVDTLGMTALDWAATREHWHIFRQLLAGGAPVTRVGADGGTVAHRVAHHDRPDMMQLLLDAGADIAHQNQWGRSPLHVAARRGCRQVAELLLAQGADADAVTKEDWTPLHVAYRAGHPALVELLLAAGANPDKADDAGLLPAEHSFERPLPVSIESARLYEYQGLYDVNEHFHFKVWVEDGKLILQDFGPVEMYPTGPDSFYCRSEPWSVAFLRDESDDVTKIVVRFLRRAVPATRRAHPQYVGSHACRTCHLGQEHGNQYMQWISSRHAGAYWRLATDWARFLALARPHYRDMANPREDDRCLNCHTTAAQDPDALFASTYSQQEGVGCESCHGPGSKYMDPSIMTDHDAFVAAGGRVPDEDTCRTCHRNPERFSFEEWWPKITHGRTVGMDSH